MSSARLALLLVLIASGTMAAQTPPAVPASTSTVTESSATCPSIAWRNAANQAFTPGEELSFVLRWGIINGGRATLSVGGIETLQGRPVYHIASEARSTGVVWTFYKVQDRSDAWLDTQSLTSLRYAKVVREGHYRIEESADFDQPCTWFHQLSYRIDQKRSEERQGRIQPYTLDVLSSLYYVRTLPMVIGETYTMDVLSGDKLWPLVVHVLKRDTVKVPAGRFDCIVVEPVLRQPGIFLTKGKKVEVWLTADDRHMPVRMRSEVVIGHVAAELVDYHAGPAARERLGGIE